MASRQVSHEEYRQVKLREEKLREKYGPALKSNSYQEKRQAEQELNNIALEVLRARQPV